MQIKKVTVSEIWNGMQHRAAGLGNDIWVTSNGSNYGLKGKPKIRFIFPDSYVAIFPSGKMRPFLDGYSVPELTKTLSPLLSPQATIFLGSDYSFPEQKTRRGIDFRLTYHYEEIKYLLIRDICETPEETRSGYDDFVADALYYEIGKSDYRSKQPTGHVNYILFPMGYRFGTRESELETTCRERAWRYRSWIETVLGPVEIVQ